MKNNTPLKALHLLGASVLLLAAGCGNHLSPTTTPRAVDTLTAETVPGEIIVKWRPTATRTSAKLSELGLQPLRTVMGLGANVLRSNNVEVALETLKKDPDVVYAEPNHVVKAFDLPNATPGVSIAVRGADDLLKECWGITKINAPAAWKISTGTGVKVAIIDTGIDYTHPDLAGHVEKGHNFVANNDDPMDDNEHGTHCAGSAGAGLGNGGIVGVAPNCTLHAIKILNKAGFGSDDGVANGIMWAADHGVQVVSMSLGGSKLAQVTVDAAKYAQDKGVILVAAMGNNNSDKPSYPAALPGVIAVGAVDNRDLRARWSNYGKNISVAAPGVDVYSTIPGNAYEYLSGTSQATPHVAGLCALMKSANPSITLDQVRSRLQTTADDLGDKGWDQYYGAGRINALKALTTNVR